jgi:hypothetical protein
MPITIEIGDAHAERLHSLARARGISDSSLICEALDMLFRQTEREQAVSEDVEILGVIGVGSDLDEASPTSRNPRDYNVTHSVPPNTLDHVERVVLR